VKADKQGRYTGQKKGCSLILLFTLSRLRNLQTSGWLQESPADIQEEVYMNYLK